MSPKRVLVVGVGSIGERHVRCFLAHPQVSVVIAEPNADLRLAVAARYGGLTAYGSVDAAMESAMDAAVVCTPAHLHIPIAIQLARAGIHVLIEKPLSTGMERVCELQSLVQQRTLVAAVAYVLRCHPALSAMRDTLLSGRFGKPLQVVAHVGQHFPTYRPAYRDIYYAHRDRGGGAVQDALTHIVNAAEWLVGPVTTLAADASHQRLEGTSVEDTAHVLARHGDVLGVYSLNQYQAPNELILTVVCELGTLRFEYHHHRYRWMNEPGSDWNDESFGPMERDTLFTTQAKQFLAAMDGAQPACSLAEGIQTLRVNLAILDAADSKQWLQI